MRADIGPAIAAHLGAICREILPGPGYTAGDGWFAVVTDEPHPLGNYAWVDSARDEAAATAACAALAATDMPACVIIDSDPLVATVEMLAAASFRYTESMPAMAVDLVGLPPQVLPAGCRVEEIDPADGAMEDAWTTALAEGYELPRPVAALFGRRSAEDPCRRFAVLCGDSMVATSLLYVHDGLAGVYGVATAPPERGRGLGAAATIAALEAARADGLATGVLQSSAMGDSVYRRIGFRQFGAIPMFVRAAP